jgi:hypothetical protein
MGKNDIGIARYRDAYKIYAGKPQGKRLRPRGKIILKWLSLQKCEEEDWIQVARMRFSGGLW